MKSKHTPSVNIIRDANKQMDYIVTSNAEKSALKIFNDFNKGYHSFSIIGSYGTGKSSFLWALEQTLKGNKIFDASLFDSMKKIEIVNLVGSYNSLIDAFNEQFKVKGDYTNHQVLFDAIYQTYEDLGKDGLLIIAIDEFGKFLEFASGNEPEREMYFIQQLAEFVNSEDRNIILLTTLHQGLDAYASKLSNSQKNEWRKVKGRLQEVTFNEPVEQLLTLAASHFQSTLGETKESAYSKKMIGLQKSKSIFKISDSYVENLKNSLYPMDIFSAYLLTLSLQKYGQNERSLFSFLIASDETGLFERAKEDKSFSIASVYDYLLENFYQTLSSSATLDTAGWRSIKEALQRVETVDSINHTVAEEVVKTLGLLQLFAFKGAKIDDEFLLWYFSNSTTKKELDAVLKKLSKEKIIRYFQYDYSYKLFEGTDLDIEGALLKAENQVPEIIDLVGKLQKSFKFPIVTAKSHSYKTGAPRLFEYVLSDRPINDIPVGEIDGFINLIFTKESFGDVLELTKNIEEATLFGYFNTTEKIANALFEIEKTEQVLKTIEDDGDKVAIKSLKSILQANKELLNHYVIDAFYNGEVTWISQGKQVPISSKKELNVQLSELCDAVYLEDLVIKNELFNKHNVSPAISSARKNFFQALVESFDQKELGFNEDKFPPEKTIYYTLLKRSEIHTQSGDYYTLSAPVESSPIHILWQVSEQFLKSATDERKKLTELYSILSAAPYKLKQGVLDFWIPTFLFIRRGDFALYSDNKFKPYLNHQELHLMTRNLKDYEIKSFELNDLKLSFFNKYRELLMQDEKEDLTVSSFIESIRPVLLTYKGLTDYEKNTKKISKEAVQLREAIKNTQDPEKVFFDDFPKALNFDVDELLRSHENFDKYIYRFQDTIEEIKNGYAELLSRIEQFIASEIIGRKCEFTTYKKELENRFDSIKEHRLIAKQKTFIQRVNSPLNDRESWLASIGQVLVGKPLSSIEDKDEEILKDNFLHIVKELDNLSALEKIKFDDKKEDVFKLDFTSQNEGLNSNMIRIPKDKIEKAKDQLKTIDEELGKDKKMRIAILAKLLKDELSNGKN